MKTAALLLLALAPLAAAQDVLTMKNGDTRAGDLVSLENGMVRLEVVLEARIPGAPPGRASTSIPLDDIESIAFGEDPDLAGKLDQADPSNPHALEPAWLRLRKWLAIPRSPAGAVGNAYANLLLRNGSPDNAARALEIFSNVENTTWSDDDRNAAAQGRLRAMVQTGRALEAVGEAEKLAEQTEDPEILIEAYHILAQATEQEYRTFLEENPRWDIDPFVIDQRHELHSKALRLYLYPALFHGSDTTRAARGLAGALAIHRLADDQALAVETARDIATLYPQTPEAAKAGEFLASLPPEVLEKDPEKEAREEIAEGIQDAPSVPQEDSQENKPSRKG
jgi:hypothetical protein